ncbi:hypothetical protein SpCBS45565_g04639 [Spizellomyces sp. 'palustris']|nr:hypothetical protein SpCBS45565_g04639 [Spizellomyces sp. 'palustris']
MITAGRISQFGAAGNTAIHPATVTFGSDKSVEDAVDPAQNLHPPPLPGKQREYIPTPNRHDRRLQFGIDCAELVHFTHWEPGGEHVKHLVVKNVVMKTQKIKYKLPQTRYFSMEFPETVTLSAGMNWTVPITFRPVAKENYHDVIEFTTSFGKFYVPVKATLPEHVLEFPETVDFALCPVRETAKKTFSLKNVGELASHFEWAIQKPFAISPRTGSLTPGSSLTVTMDFKPEDASVFGATAVCTFGDRQHWEKSKVAQSMTVYGLGKFSFLAIEGNQRIFDFGDVFVGRSVEKKFVLQNLAAVHANFRIKRPESDTDPYFDFSTLSGTVPSGQSMDITVTYTPVAAGMQSTDYYDITTLSGNTIRITCSGRGIGPKVALNTNVVNFNDVPAATTATRALFLQNHSPITAFYQFLTEANGIFRIDKPWGSIGPHSSVALTVKFTPFEPINYYRRVYCLVEHHDGLILDILGTCYNDKRRPATFHQKHIENYQIRKKNGLWSFGPEHLEEMLKNGTITCNQGVLSWIDPGQANMHITKHTVDSTYEDCKVASEYFYENTGDSEAVTLVETHIDFGSCSRYRVIDCQYIRIANNTKGKMSCVWIVPGENSGDEPVFTVTPVVADILPKSTTDFRVNFRPTIDNSIYGAQLECFVYFKSMRNFRLVNQDTFTPPWCLTPMVTGNTFSPEQDTFIPKIDFGATRLDFPSCHVDKSVYRTVRVSNTGDTPVHFAILDGGLTGIGGGTALASLGGAAFTVKPRLGLLKKNESRLLVFRFSPSEQRVYEQALKCSFNSSAANSYDLQMRGVGYFPHLTFGTQNTLCFKPTCIGAVAKRTFPARNTSRITVNFEWRIPQQYSSIISIEPMSGKLAPNSAMDLVCTFAPNVARNWVIKLPCYYHHELREPGVDYDHQWSPDFSRRRTTFSVVGQGTHGKILAQPEILDLNAVLVHSLVEREMILHNPTECDVVYHLELTRQRKSKTDTDEGKESDEIGTEEEGGPVPNSVNDSGLEIVQKSKILPARSHQALRVRVRLSEQVPYRYRVYYTLEPQSLHSSPSLLSLATESQREHLCDVIAVGVHPLIQVTDIRCEGFSKSLLWQLFSLHRFNNLLSAVDTPQISSQVHEDNSFPTDSKSEYSTPDQKPDSNILSTDFDFGATPVGCQPTVYHLSLRNSGVVPVEWVFYFPNDLEIEIEHWADPGDYTDEQLHHNLIIDNELFMISPKAGWLDPNEAVHVTMTYSHEFAGLHKLPVMFKLKNGTTQSSKEVMINFVGYSVPPAKKCLHFHSSEHTFQPVSIGTLEPPVQLMNRGAVSLEYTLDLSPLERLKEENFNVEILQCRKRSGTIAPGHIEHIDWVFRPLEIKEYEVEIPISVTDGKSRIITFRGQGVQEMVDPEVDERQDSKEYSDPIPSVQELDMPRQMARLSRERINFGHIPLNATVRELVIISNTEKEADVSFNWIIPSSLVEIFKISPPSGLLAPGESKVCRLSFTPTNEPRVYETDVICEIMNDTELAAYNEAKDVIETARREGRPLSIAIQTAAPALRRDSTRLSVAAGGSQHDLTKMKYRTLPPITPPKTPSGTVSGRGSETEAPTKEGRPISALSTSSDISPFPGLSPAPEPFHLFLAIIGRSHPVEECRRLYTGYDNFFHERKPDHETAPLESQTFSSPSARALLTSILTSLLDDVFQDQDIQILPEKMRHEPLPYYVQIATSRPMNGIVLDEPHIADNKVREYGQFDAIEGVIGMEQNDPTNELNKELGEMILSTSEFQNMVETVLEGTIFNLMQEANLDEFDMTKHQMAIMR